MLWDPSAHEPVVEDGWDEDRVRMAVRDIAADAEHAFADGWPAHPADAETGDPGPWSGLYLGGAGVIDALRRLADRGFAELQRDYLPYLEHLDPDAEGPSLLVGETGIVLVRHRLSPSRATAERLRELVAANVEDERRELLWGSPGTMLVAHELGFDDLRQASAERLLADRDPESGLWTQHLYGRVEQNLGAAHGFAGCVLALGAVDGAGETARRYAVVRDGLANWPPLADGSLVANDTIRVQWCHGAPGMLTSLGDVLDEDWRSPRASSRGAQARSPRVRASVTERPATATRS
ncbi:MAG TPA: lanthionine synthetase LanC family protein [Gaiellaceae bacterium]